MDKKVLIVDDDYAFSSFARRLLEDHHLKTVIASSGTEGLSKAEQERPDLILLDLGMVDMDGLEVLKKLKDNKATAHIPVVLCSMTRGKKEIEKGAALGAADFLPKPLSPQTSIPKLKAILLGQ